MMLDQNSRDTIVQGRLKAGEPVTDSLLAELWQPFGAALQAQARLERRCQWLAERLTAARDIKPAAYLLRVLSNPDFAIENADQLQRELDLSQAAADLHRAEEVEAQRQQARRRFGALFA